MHWTSNIFGHSFTKIVFLGVSLNYSILTFKKTVCLKNNWMQHWQLQWYPEFKCQRFRVDWSSNQKLFHHHQHPKNHSINQLNSSNHFWDIPDLRFPWSMRLHPFLDHAHPIIIRVTFGFPKFVSACKKSAHFIINSFLRYRF